MKTAILFASYLPHEDRLYIGKQFFNVFVNNFKDADIYVGINPGTVDGWASILDEYKKELNIEYGYVERDLYSKSDAGAFQKALLMLKDSGKKYDNIWFVHTKGGHYNDSHRAEQRDFMIENFLNKREILEEQMHSKSNYGVYGPVITVNMTPWPQNKCPDNFLDVYYDFPYRSTDLCYLYTFYLMKGNIVHDFINNCSNNFWEDKKNIYFFEDAFPHVATKMGYEQLYGITQNFPKGNIVTDDRIKNIKNKWMKDNGINYSNPD